VAKLRAALGAGDGPLTSNGPGYVLDVPRETVDVLRIEDRLRSARESMATDPSHASELIASCREDWTGAPFADLADHHILAVEREHLLRLKDELDDAELAVNVAAGDPALAVLQLERAVAADPTHEPNWIRLITAYYASGRQREALEAYQRASGTLLDQLGVDPSPQLQRLEVQILRQEIPTAEGSGSCPYKGLVSYQIGDGASFHGRSDITDEVVNLILSTPVGVVVGPSGVGKSSVLRAGLGHRVVSGQVPGLATVAVMTPGAQPLRSLYRAAENVDLVVVDQFEEIFTLTDDARRREEFVDEFLSLTDRSLMRVVISVRADFYGHCLSLAALSPILGRHQVNIGPMSPIGLREAIEGPAVEAGLQIEPALLETVVSEVADQPGALPLLSHALSETWRRRSGSTMTLEAYREAGSIAGAISATAERLHAGLDDHGRGRLELLFRRLVEPGSRTEHTGRAVARTELDDAGFEPDLIDRLVGARLLTASTDKVEVAHEALITAWPRLTEWIDAERENIVVHQRLTRAANAWLESDEDEADLYRGNKLASALSWRDDAAPVLTAQEEQFLLVSEDRARDELARQRRANRRLRILVGVSVMAMIAAMVASFLAVGRTRDADRRREQIEVDQLATVVAADESLSQTDRLRAAAALHGRTATAETAGFLLDAILGSHEVISRSDLDIVALGGSAPTYASGMAIFATDEDLQPAIVDVITMELDRLNIGFIPKFVIAGPEGLIAVHDETYEVIDLSDRRALGPAPILDGEPTSVALSSDGLVLALGYDAGIDAHVDVFDVIEGSLITRIDIPSDRIRELELSSGGTMLIAGFGDLDGPLGLWDITTAERVFQTHVDAGSTAPVTSSAFNIRGDAIALGRGDGTVEIWRASDGLWLQVSALRRHTDEVTWIEFDFEDALVASSALDGTVVLWDAVDGQPLSGPVEFGASGELVSFFDIETGDVVTLDSMGHTWRWSAQPGGGLVTTIGVGSGAPPSAESSAWFGVADGAAVVVIDTAIEDLGLDSGVLDVVGGRSGDYVVVYPNRLDWYRRRDELVMSIQVAANSLNGRIVVSEQTIAYVDTQTGRIVVMASDGTLVGEIEIHKNRGDVVRLDLNPSGSDLIFSTETGELIWYALDSFDTGVLLPSGSGHDGHFVSGDRVVAVGVEGIQIVDLEASEPEVVGVGRDAIAVALDQGRGLSATLNDSGTVTIWDLDVGQQIGPTFSPLATDLPRSVGFDGGGRLVVGGRESSAVVPVDQDEWLDLACALVDALDPGGDHPPDPRLTDFDSCS
jgi:DNA-binding SARP family transcriptional activator/WD40 repeat protein